MHCVQTRVWQGNCGILQHTVLSIDSIHIALQTFTGSSTAQSVSVEPVLLCPNHATFDGVGFRPCQRDSEHMPACCSLVSCQVDAVLSGKLAAMQALLGEWARPAGVGYAMLCELYELHRLARALACTLALLLRGKH
jgi:hypothetical protein